MRKISFALFISSALCWLASCSAQKNNIFSKSYHNTTAHYNAYFLARENIKFIVNYVYENQQEDYNKILKVLPVYDTNLMQGAAEQIENTLKMASLPIQYHENSKWVDDSYLLVGKARMYNSEFTHAIETFKYVNTHSEDKDTKHEALVDLMRTFIMYNELGNAQAVADHLKKERLNKENQRNLEMAKAHLAQIREEYDKLASSLSKATMLTSSRKSRARMHFVLGQTYQHLQIDSASAYHYKKCLKSNPTYELSFYAKLYLAQVSRFTKGDDAKKIRKYFRKLLKDEKNIEYQDKIYYEMAGFELKQSNLALALEYLKKSVSVSSRNQAQKGYGFLRLGQLYYDEAKNFPLAAAYYDSTVNVLPKDDERYEEVLNRQKILKEFVQYYTIVQEQDSLLALSEVSQDSLNALIDEVISREAAQKKKAERTQKKQERYATSYDRQASSQFNASAEGTADGDTWYFYNMAAVSRGRNEFKRVWGNRPLEDNWRRSQKQAVATFEEDNTAELEAEAARNEKLAKETEAQEADKAKAQMLANIPTTPEAREEALNKVDEALYQLGKVYNFKLKEENNAIESFKSHYHRFPDSEYAPEVLYQLYLIYKADNDPQQEVYKEALLSRFPESVYAKLVENPNYLEESLETSNRIQQLYQIAYDYYLKNDVQQANMLVNRALELYPDNDFSDRLRILKIMLYAKTDGIYKYQFELQQFIEKYPESELKDYAQTLLDASKKLKDEEARKKGITFIKYWEQEHFLIVAFETKLNLSEKVANDIDSFIKERGLEDQLKIGTLTLGENYTLVLINEFKDKLSAEAFFINFSENGPLTSYDKSIFDSFVISKDNFQIFYQAGALKEYTKFFKENYLKDNAE